MFSFKTDAISANTKALVAYCLCIAVILIGGITLNKEAISQQINAQALITAQQQFGALHVAPEQEEKINHIAREMGISYPIIIRKMNQAALAMFGYHNAFAYIPQLCNLIPTGATPFIFISEGFFEDLSPEEQRFLIGHELIHINEGHLNYLQLSLLLLFLLLAGGAWIVRKQIKKSIQNKTPAIYHRYIMAFITCVLLWPCGLITSLTALAYRRHIERDADCRSLEMLCSYEGCLKIADRWQDELKVAAHNPYFGLTSDHPSCAERKAYCLELQKQHYQKDLI